MTRIFGRMGDQRKRRPGNRFELLSCAWSDHVLFGTGARTIRPEDAPVARLTGGVRWHRCLRCDAWVPRDAPAVPETEEMGELTEVTPPLRGPRLRDRYVLRLIALDRAVHVALLATLDVVLVLFLSNQHSIRSDYTQIMAALSGSAPGTSAAHGVLAHLQHILTVAPKTLWIAVVVVSAYGVLEATEMVGLWFGRRWAEYLTFVATIALVPYEVYDLGQKTTVLRIVTLVLNLAIAAYLLLAKRLFGARGGYAQEHRRKEQASGWPAILATTPPMEIGAARTDPGAGGVPALE